MKERLFVTLVVPHCFPCLYRAGAVFSYLSLVSFPVSSSVCTCVCQGVRKQGWCSPAVILFVEGSLAPPLAACLKVPHHPVPSFIHSFRRSVSQAIILTGTLTCMPLLSQESVSKQNRPKFSPPASLHSKRKRQGRNVINT